MKVICTNEQNTVIKIKVKLLDKIKSLKGKERRKASDKIFAIFDTLPDFKEVKLVDVKCKKCTYPECDHAKNMVDLLGKVSEAKAEDVEAHAKRSKYINKLFKKKCSH